MRSPVSVPVLSMATVSMPASFSSALARVTSTPRRLRRTLAAATAAGVASDSAHGQVTTSTASVAAKARVGSNHSHSPATTAASTRITATNCTAARSASSAIGGRSACARSISAPMAASVESCARACATTWMAAPRFTLPPSSRSPARCETGIDSPVINASSSVAVSFSSSASTGTTAPRAISRRSPATTSAIGTRWLPPAVSRDTCAGRLRASASLASRLPRRRLLSMWRPSSSRKMNMATESK